MKRVRFETPKSSTKGMDCRECHSPRPFIEREPHCEPLEYYERVLPYSSNPVQRYENSNSTPYPMVNRTSIPLIESKHYERLSSNDLDLSMLDASSDELRNHVSYKPAEFRPPIEKSVDSTRKPNLQVLSSIQNEMVTPPNVLCKDNSFFIRRDNLDKTCALQNQLTKLNLGKENYPLAKKAEMINNMTYIPISPKKVSCPQLSTAIKDMEANNSCTCHHCVRTVSEQYSGMKNDLPQHTRFQSPFQNMNTASKTSCNLCPCTAPLQLSCHHCEKSIQNFHTNCRCENTTNPPSASPQNAVDKKTWAIKKYEQNKKTECLDIEKQSNVVKEKREPTVADLFKIIKLQNEQLQLLQEKVDKFISSNNSAQHVQPLPIQNYVTEHVALQTIDSKISEQHKISIGVMTSFEMVRTSTVINQEFVKQTNENAQIQCNRSQISIKEVVSKSPVTLNFLDGILPVEKSTEIQANSQENVYDDKTMNELSLYNVQVDNATTPLISPEQSMYLDVRDYSDSDCSSDDQSNVGWTYYNKVMTHVNGMLQDSDMPSSASALCRNTRQQCVQMQIDKSNLSVTKRVKFGDDPLGLHQPHLYAVPSDTSLKMNQLAAKYLPKHETPMPQRRASDPVTRRTDMSFATRNYMERHKLLQGAPSPAYISPPPGEMPRFLDITALKQQPKLL